MGVDSGRRGLRREAVGVALNYPRAGVSVPPTPQGWGSAGVVAEVRSVLLLDDTTGVVTANVRSVWRPSADHVLPGGAERQSRRHRRLVQRIAESFTGSP